jgi:hypothetical protein
MARRAGITKPVGPHTLQYAFITAPLDAGVPQRDAQEAASHADPRTTMRDDRARASLDRHATYIVAAFLAGAARRSTVPFGRPGVPMAGRPSRRYVAGTLCSRLLASATPVGVREPCYARDSMKPCSHANTVAAAR